jgi:hypothetical protein
MSQDHKAMKHQFSAQLKKCLEIQYNGRIPSISTIARDFSLKANHLPHVSGETVRKWLRAETLPQYPRMQSLADWLGPELLEPFENWQSRNNHSRYTRARDSHTQNRTADRDQLHKSQGMPLTPDEVMHFMLMIQKISREDFNLIFKLVEELYNRLIIEDL